MFLYVLIYLNFTFYFIYLAYSLPAVMYIFYTTFTCINCKKNFYQT